MHKVSRDYTEFGQQTRITWFEPMTTLGASPL
jgi:hypothetical protein